MRRRGYGSQALALGLQAAKALGLQAAKALGLERILITCDDDNVGSIKIIEKNGGVFENVVTDNTGTRKRRYWITLD